MPGFLKIMQGLGSPISGMFNIASNLIQNRQNMKMAEYAYQKELEQWNRQNEYNKPINQMARFKEAGLNPNLMYGQGTPGNATDSPNYSAPHLQFDNPFPNLGNDIGQLRQTDADVALKGANEDLARANKDNVEQDTNNKKLDNVIKALDIINKRIKNETDEEQLSILKETKDELIKQEEELLRKITAEADTAEENLNLIRSNVALTNEQINLVKKQTDEVVQRIEESKSRVDLNRAHSYSLTKQGNYYAVMANKITELLPYEKRKFTADYLLTRAETGLKYVQTELAEKNIQLTTQQIANLAVAYMQAQADYNITVWKQKLRECGIDPDNHSMVGTIGNMARGLLKEFVESFGIEVPEVGLWSESGL